MTEPGGHLQWTDSDVPSFRVEKTSPSNNAEPLEQLLKLTASQSPSLSPKYVPELPKLFAAAGFENVVSDVKDAPGDLALAKHDCSLVVHELVARKTGNQDYAEKLKALMPAVQTATRQGSVMSFTRWHVVGRKPFTMDSSVS